MRWTANPTARARFPELGISARGVEEGKVLCLKHRSIYVPIRGYSVFDEACLWAFSVDFTTNAEERTELLDHLSRRSYRIWKAKRSLVLPKWRILEDSSSLNRFWRRISCYDLFCVPCSIGSCLAQWGVFCEWLCTIDQAIIQSLTSPRVLCEPERTFHCGLLSNVHDGLYVGWCVIVHGLQIKCSKRAKKFVIHFFCG